MTLARLFARLGYRYGLEIGTGAGVYSEILCREIPDLALVTIDRFAPYDGYLDYTDANQLETDYRTATERLAPYRVEIIRRDSMAALNDFPDDEFDFAYIDANHNSPWVDNDIYWYRRKVRPGGIVSGHDYMEGHPDTMRAVERYAEHPWFLVGKMHETGDADLIPSWFWVRS